MTQTIYPQARVRDWAGLSVLVVAVVLLAIDATVLTLAIPSITEALNPTGTQVLWIGDIYSLTIAGFLITMGNVADRFGRKKVLLIGSIFFGLSSLFAAYASSAQELIIARSLLGLSAASLMPSTLSLIRTIFHDPHERTRAVSIWAAASLAASAAGPIVGGFLLEHFWWGSVFLINVPLVVILVIAGFFLLPESKNPEGTSIDLISVILSILAIMPIVYTLKHFFSSWHVSPVFIIGVAAAFLLFRRQRNLNGRAPLIDAALFKVPSFAGAVTAQFIGVFAFNGLIYFFSQYLQMVRGYSPLQAGLIELPSVIASVVVVFIASKLVRKYGLGKALALGPFIAGIAFFLLALVENIEGWYLISAVFFIIGLGGGLSFTLSTDAIVGSAPKNRSGAASAISETSYELGVALGIAVLGSLATAFYRGFNGIGDSIATAYGQFNQEIISHSEYAQATHAFSSAMVITTVITGVLLLCAAYAAYKLIPGKVRS